MSAWWLRIRRSGSWSWRRSTLTNTAGSTAACGALSQWNTATTGTVTTGLIDSAYAKPPVGLSTIMPSAIAAYFCQQLIVYPLRRFGSTTRSYKPCRLAVKRLNDLYLSSQPAGMWDHNMAYSKDKYVVCKRSRRHVTRRRAPVHGRGSDWVKERIIGERTARSCGQAFASCFPGVMFPGAKNRRDRGQR